MPSKLPLVNTRLSYEEYDKLKEIAKRKNKKIYLLVRQILIEYISQNY